MAKLITVLWLCMLLQVSASDIYAQRVTLKLKNANLKELLNHIQKQTSYDFMYNAGQLKDLGSFNIDVKDMDLTTVLRQYLRPKGLSFIIEDNVVVIQRTQNLIAHETPYQKAVRGKIIDSDGNPLKGVSVTVTGRPDLSQQSDFEGRFNLPGTVIGKEVTFKFLGFQTKNMMLTEQESEMLVQLTPSTADIGEVVVTGVFQKKEATFTGASTTVTSEQLKEFGNRNLITSLRNIEPSFNIIESNQFGSDPNRMPEIQIRGNSNIPNVGDLQNETRIGLNTPLVILDGFESTLQKLLDINENDVESITILKDASATAMYGSRGANGVIVISTKKPIAGKLRVSFGSQSNIENPDLTDYNLLNSREKLELERLAGYYESVNSDTDYELKKYYNYILSEVNRGVETDWLSIPLRTSIGQRHQLRIEGGDKSLRYAASAQYNNIAGVMKGSNRNTWNGGILLSYDLEKVRFKNNTQITQGVSNESPYGTFSDYVRLNPYLAPYDDNGNVNKQLGYSGDQSYQKFWYPLPTNPLYNATLNTYDISKYTELVNNTSIEWNISSAFVLRTQLGLTKNISQRDRFRPSDHTAFADYGVDDLMRRGDYLYSIGNGLRYDGSLNIGYNKTFGGRHNIYASGDFNVRQNKISDYSFLAEGFSNPRLDFIGSALQYAEGKSPTGSENYTRAVGLSANTSYNFEDRYFADFVYRYDGSSQFGSKRRFAPFWSFGLGWNLHKESFLKDATFVNRLKLRGSTGIVGSQNFSAYQALATYRYYTDESYHNWMGSYLLGLGNDELLWQQTQKHNIGTDVELFNRRVKMKLDIYREETKDLVSSINLPASSGFDSYVENIGRLENKGFEAQLTLVLLNQLHNRFYWSITGNILTNRNKVLETSQALKDALKAVKNNSTNPGVVYEEGFSSNTIWVVQSLGIDPSNGKEVFLSRNGTPTYMWDGNDVIAAGSTEAKVFGNFSTMVRYGGFSINAVFRYTAGGHQYNHTLVNRVESTNYKYQMDKRVFYDRWKNPGDQASFKGLLVTTPTYKSSRFVQAENTLVLSNVNLYYDFQGQSWLERFGLSQLRITSNISEPLYLSSIKQERGTSYPFSRQYSFGFNATF